MASLTSSVHAGMHILEHNQSEIEPAWLRRAAGIVILEHYKGAFFFSGHVGTGFVSKRLGPNQWSFPSSVALFGGGVGMQIGLQKSDIILILESPSEMETYERSGQLAIGSNVGATLIYGVDMQVGASAGRGGTALLFSEGRSKGAFVGVSIDGSALVTNYFANRSFYGKGHRIRKILNNRIVPDGKSLHVCLDLNDFLVAMGNDDLTNHSARILPITDEEDEDIDLDEKRRKEAGCSH
mmetsp:Transcript_4943/g.6430  ORF Transcript_4943/g.6430 Transcript_4943/m.6430 type:complete len:239 (-) Transcript_4943:758-1474(-)